MNLFADFLADYLETEMNRNAGTYTKQDLYGWIVEAAEAYKEQQQIELIEM